MSHLKELSRDEGEFEEAAMLLHDSWVKNNVDGLRVERIFRIEYPEHMTREHRDYRAVLKAELGEQGMQRVRLFHGTAFTCQLASKAVTHLCTRKCEGCNIVRMSFRLAYIGKNRRRTKWQRLGNGIYFSPHASKCHFYSGTGTSKLPSDPSREVRGMFLADVVLGRSYKPSTMELERLCPPPGYHSSYGEAGKCGLNYDEYAVFDEVACLPLLLYVYSYTSTTE